MIASQHISETETSFQSKYEVVESRSRPQQEILSRDPAARHEDFIPIQPMAPGFEGFHDAPATSLVSEPQKMSTYIYVPQQKELCVWDAFHVLKRRLAELTEPTASDLLCLSHLENRFRHLFPKDNSSAPPI